MLPHPYQFRRGYFFTNYTNCNKIDEFEYSAVLSVIGECMWIAAARAQKHHSTHSHTRYDHMKLHDLWVRSMPMNINCVLVYGHGIRIPVPVYFRFAFCLHNMATTTSFSCFCNFVMVMCHHFCTIAPIGPDKFKHKSLLWGKKQRWKKYCSAHVAQSLNINNSMWYKMHTNACAVEGEMNHDFIPNTWSARYLCAQSSYVSASHRMLNVFSLSFL